MPARRTAAAAAAAASGRAGCSFPRPRARRFPRGAGRPPRAATAAGKSRGTPRSPQSYSAALPRRLRDARHTREPPLESNARAAKIVSSRPGTCPSTGGTARGVQRARDAVRCSGRSRCWRWQRWGRRAPARRAATRPTCARKSRRAAPPAPPVSAAAANTRHLQLNAHQSPPAASHPV